MPLPQVISHHYNMSTRYLKIFYANGAADLFYPVSPFMYESLLRSTDKTAFICKYMIYDLSFSRISLAS
jgi:hypothetical protein